MCAFREGSQLKTYPFLSVSLAINLITSLSLIPNVDVHRKPRWWYSSHVCWELSLVTDFLHTNLDFPHNNVDFLHTNEVPR